MRVLSIRIVEQIILHIQSHGPHVPRGVIFGKSQAGQDKHKAEKDYEECLRIHGSMCFHGMTDLHFSHRTVKFCEKGTVLVACPAIGINGDPEDFFRLIQIDYSHHSFLKILTKNFYLTTNSKGYRLTVQFKN